LTASDRLHVTLFSLGGLPDQLVAKACEAIGEVRAAPFEISFDRTMSFRGQPGSRPFVLTGRSGLSQLKLFRRALWHSHEGMACDIWDAAISRRISRCSLTIAQWKNNRSVQSAGLSEAWSSSTA